MSKPKVNPETNAVPEKNIELVSGGQSAFQRMLSPQSLEATTAIVEGKIPKQYISEHPGKGGKIFKYVKHTHATRVMNAAFGHAWNYDVLQTEVYSDGSASALCRLEFAWQDMDLNWFTRHITEVGVTEKKNGVPIAMHVAMASSRGLLRCMLRAFNFGAEFYEDEDEITPEHAYMALYAYAKKRHMEKAAVDDALLTNGINEENIVDLFSDAYDIISKAAEQAVIDFEARKQAIAEEKRTEELARQQTLIDNKRKLIKKNIIAIYQKKGWPVEDPVDIIAHLGNLITTLNGAATLKDIEDVGKICLDWANQAPKYEEREKETDKI